MPNYATKSDLENRTGGDTSQFAKKDDFGKLKLEIEKLDTNKPTFSMLQLQKGKGVDYILSWKSKGSFSFTISTQHSHFLFRLNFFDYKIGIEFDGDHFVVEQIIYTTKIVNVYIVYELDKRPKIFLNNFKLKNCLFDTSNTTKIVIKVNGCILAYQVHDGAGSRTSGNDFARNVVIFGVDNGSLSYSDNRKK